MRVKADNKNFAGSDGGNKNHCNKKSPLHDAGAIEAVKQYYLPAIFL